MILASRKKIDFLKFQPQNKNYYEIYQVARKGNLCSYVTDYQYVFKFRTCNRLKDATTYLSGLFITERGKRNIERMVEQNGSNYQSQQHFITNSPWSAKEAMKVVAKKTNKALGSPIQQVLSFDESSNKKAGRNSVAVSRQHNGNLGKIENSQTGVYASLSKGDKVGLINCRLFLPAEWVNDPHRCRKAGMPAADIVHKTKPELAIEMLKELIEDGLQFGWITADGLYGQSYEFCKAIDEQKKDFVVDVHKDQHVYIEQPEIYMPQRKGSSGRKPTKRVANTQSIRVDAYLKTLASSDFTGVKIRKGTKGWLKNKAHKKRVWVWDHQENQARERTLIITKGKEVKYNLSNINVEDKTTKEFVFMQSQRHFIERAFEDGKGEPGLVDYQIRKYQSWYHHQALVMMAMNHVLITKIEYSNTLPLLSVRDVRLQIIQLLKFQGVYIEKEIDQMLTRHKQKYRDIKRYYKNEKYFD